MYSLTFLASLNSRAHLRHLTDQIPSSFIIPQDLEGYAESAHASGVQSRLVFVMSGETTGTETGAGHNESDMKKREQNPAKVMSTSRDPLAPPGMSRDGLGNVNRNGTDEQMNTNLQGSEKVRRLRLTACLCTRD